MTYTAEKPTLTPPSDELRARIPGWGADLDPADRPSVPRERLDLPTGAHWDFPDRQQEKWPRERSIEHKFLTPVFGTSAPLRGVAGALRKVAYEYSEGRAAHWLILMVADRVDALEHHLKSLLTLRPDNPFTETGIGSEFSHHGFRSRVGQKRADLAHQPIDPVIVAGPWIAAAVEACSSSKNWDADSGIEHATEPIGVPCRSLAMCCTSACDVAVART